MMVVFLGMDGSGKSTVIDTLQHELATSLSCIQVFHLSFPLLNHGPNRTIVSNPHGKPVYSTPLSLVKLIYFAVRYQVGYWRYYRSVQSARHLLILDRYYHDLLADPKRYRYGASLRFATWVSYLIPRPRHFILLDLPVETAYSRKPEVPLEEARRIREGYLKLAARIPDIHVVDASQPVAEVVRQVKAVLGFYSEQEVIDAST